jgi:hypothetical protein
LTEGENVAGARVGSEANRPLRALVEVLDVGEAVLLSSGSRQGVDALVLEQRLKRLEMTEQLPQQLVVQSSRLAPSGPDGVTPCSREAEVITPLAAE